MKKRWMFAVLLFVFSLLFLFSVLVYRAFVEGKTEKEEEIIQGVPVVIVEVKKDTPIEEFYNTNSLIRSRMFYQTFLERFAKANNMVDGGFNVLPVGIYFIPVDGVFFKNTKTGVYSVMTINAEPGMTAGEFYKTNSLVNRKLSWNFFLERFAEFQEIPNEEKEFRKLKPGAWIMPVANVFFWTPQGIKSPLDLYSAEFPKTLPKTLIAVIHSKGVKMSFISKIILFFTLSIIITIIAFVIIANFLKLFNKTQR